MHMYIFKFFYRSVRILGYIFLYNYMVRILNFGASGYEKIIFIDIHFLFLHCHKP